MIEEVDHDRMLEAAMWRDMIEIADIERRIDAERKPYDPDAALRQYRAWKAEDERRARQRREYRKATRKREAVIAGYLANVDNLDIIHRVRELARDAGGNVIDFVEYRRKPKRKRVRESSRHSLI